MSKCSQCEELLDELEDITYQACAIRVKGTKDEWELDSFALSSYASAIRLLAEHGRVKIKREYGRRVIATMNTKAEA